MSRSKCPSPGVEIFYIAEIRRNAGNEYMLQQYRAWILYTKGTIESLGTAQQNSFNIMGMLLNRADEEANK